MFICSFREDAAANCDEEAIKMIRDYLNDDDEEYTDSCILQEKGGDYPHFQTHKKVKYSPESNVSKGQSFQNMNSSLHSLEADTFESYQLNLSLNLTFSPQNLFAPNQSDYPEYVIQQQ